MTHTHTTLSNRCFWLFLVIMNHGIFQAQTIDIYSITQERQIGGDQGYTLDGSQMKNDTRLKLLNPVNFGPHGTYPKTITITDDFRSSGSLREVSKLPRENLFFFGTFNKKEPTIEAFTTEEIDSLYRWSLRGGKMIITTGIDFVTYSYFSSILNDYWNYMAASILTLNIDCIGTTEGKNSGLFNGPFGQMNNVRQGGGARGFFYKYPSDIKVMAATADGNPTIYMDCKTLDMMVIDVDIFTFNSNMAYYNEQHEIVIEGITMGDKITLNNDKFLGNVIAFMDKLQQPPMLSKDGNMLSVGSDYLSYQWYKNDEAIGGANSALYNLDPNTPDNYYVEVEVNGGCKVRSNAFRPECEIFVPTAFSPDNNDMNDKACIYGSCLEKIDFRIFNRWGELIFQAGGAEACWDGTYKGAKAPSGIYAWSLEATRKSGSSISQKGNITLIR